ncbi:winged helix-turn-helix domain-containing protein [Ruminococcaceae bacterium OttesenSCG-928-A11]|nr:winged helix-turn-helix domain-containing protein [Ruminococcaceae bacterium OttesenSCG-928-A11]
MIGRILTISDSGGQVYVNDAQDAWYQRGFMLVTKNIEEALLENNLDDYYMIAITMSQDHSPEFRRYSKLIRALTDAPLVIFPYEKAAIEDATSSLYAGATQMIPLPVDMQWAIDSCIELIQQHMNSMAQREKPLTLYADYKIFLNSGRYSASVDGREVELSKVEFDILSLLMEYRGNYLTYSQIFRQVWGEEYIDGPPTLLHTHIKNLRKKLQGSDSLPQYIRTKPRVGYSFSPRLTDDKTA